MDGGRQAQAAVEAGRHVIERKRKRPCFFCSSGGCGDAMCLFCTHLSTAVMQPGGSGVRITMPLNKGFAGFTATKGLSLMIADAYADPRFYAPSDIASGFLTQQVLTVPITDQVLPAPLSLPAAAVCDAIASIIFNHAATVCHLLLLAAHSLNRTIR